MERSVNNVRSINERDKAIGASLWHLKSAVNPDAVVISPQVKLENYKRNIVNIREIINNGNLFKEEPSPAFIQAHQKSLEIWEEKLQRLYEEHPELCEEQELDLIEPTVPNIYKEQQNEYEQRIIYNKYYESVLNRLKESKLTAAKLQVFLSKSHLTPEHKALIRSARMEDGTFDFYKALKEIED